MVLAWPTTKVIICHGFFVAPALTKEGLALNQKTPIGKMLLEQKTINQDQLGDALEKQQQEGGRLASKLMEMGVTSEEDLLLALGDQLGVPAVDLARTVINLKSLDLVPEQVAMDAMVLPLSIEPEQVILGMANPLDKSVVDEITFVTGKKVEPYVVLEARLKKVIREAYALHKRDPKAEFYYGDRMGERGESFSPSGHIEFVTKVLPEPDVVIEPEEELIDIEISTEVATDEQVLAKMVAGDEPDEEPHLILVVDDEVDIVNLLKKALEAEGFKVVTASRGLEALQAVKAHSPSLVLLDAMLPEIHGFEICRKIKSSKRFGHIPVIMISAVYKGWRYALDAKDAYGADDYFEKPFRLVPLLRRVRELLDSEEIPPDDQAKLEEANAVYQKGVSLYREKKFEEAETVLRQACGLDPFSANIHYALANVLLARNLIYDAMREYEQTVELKPDLFAPLRNLAILYQKKGFKNKAVEMWERALRCSPDGEREQVREQLLKLL